MKAAIGGIVIFLAACSGSEGSEPKGTGGKSTGGTTTGGMAAAAGKAQVGDGGEPMDRGGGGSGGTGGAPVATGGDAGSGEGCDLAHRVGTYLYSAVERPNGNCGALSDQVVAIEDALAVPDNCALDKPDKVSVDKCDLTRSFTCALDGDAGSFSATAFTSEAQGGDVVSGVVTMRIVDSAGAFVCTSTYDVSYERQ